LIEENFGRQYVSTNEMSESIEKVENLVVKEIYTARDFNGQIHYYQKFRDIVEQIKLEKSMLLKNDQ